MPIASTDIVFYASANMPENNQSDTGGAIDTATKVVFTDIAATDAVDVLSNNAADTTQDVTITGRNAAGVIVSETVNLDGTTPQTTTQTFERILKVVMSATAVGTVTVRRATGDTEIATLEAGITAVRRLFYDASADASGGSARNYFEKIFVKNNHGTLTLTNAILSETSDPTTFVTFDVEDHGQSSTGMLGTRLNITPSGTLYGFDGNPKYVTDSGLPAGSGQGIWVQLSLAAGETPDKSTYTLRLAGTTT